MKARILSKRIWSIGGLVLLGLTVLAVVFKFFISFEKKWDKERLPPGQAQLTREEVMCGGIEIRIVKPAPFEEKMQFVGELGLNEEQTSRVSTRLGGRVLKILADYGQSIKAEQALAVIESVELGQAQMAYLQSEAVYRVAQQAYERAKLLWQEKAISRAEYLERQAKFEQDQAERDYAENRLHLLGLSESDIARRLKAATGKGLRHNVDPTFVLRSPLGGKVVDRRITPGQMVRPDEELFIIAETSILWCSVQIPEKDLPLVRLGSKAIIKVNALPHEDFAGKIDYISVMVDKASRMTKARVKVDNSRDLLKAGMFVDVSVTASVRTVCTIPESAVISLGDAPHVFIEQKPCLFIKRAIKPGAKMDGRVEVLEGLQDGERVVVQGTFTLKSELARESLEAE
ncbi:efflux RND transporter periplasmic adaptor subunit [Desulfobacca acetoxidans]